MTPNHEVWNSKSARGQKSKHLCFIDGVLTSRAALNIKTSQRRASCDETRKLSSPALLLQYIIFNPKEGKSSRFLPPHLAPPIPVRSTLALTMSFSQGDEGPLSSRKNPHLSHKETSQLDQTDSGSAGSVASCWRMGTDCWHVLQSPLNFTELFSPFLADQTVICVL